MPIPAARLGGGVAEFGANTTGKAGLDESPAYKKGDRILMAE